MNRREALKGAAYAAALFGLPPARGATAAPPLPDKSVLERDPEAYWGRIRKEQFLLPDWRTFLNNGSLGVAPKVVVEAIVDYLNRSAALMVEEYPRWGYETLDEHRKEIAEFVGCRPEDLALTHNATEAMSTIANGLDLKAGDEVIMTDHEHPGGSCCWLQRQARHGIQVRQVKLPIPPSSPEQIADVLVSAIGPRTRVLSFSGITTTTGLVMPVRQICDAARSKGVITVIDGAHINGQIPVRLADLGCDYFAGSPHKWLFAPAGCGLLYGREEMLDRLWVNVVTSGWDKKEELKAARFQMVGTNNRAIFEGFLAGVRFLKQIGPGRVYDRIHQLARGVYEKARTLPNVEMLTPADERMYAGIVSFRIKGLDLKPVWAMCKQRRIWALESDKFRVSTHIHTRPSDVDMLFEVIREVQSGKAA